MTELDMDKINITDNGQIKIQTVTTEELSDTVNDEQLELYSKNLLRELARILNN